MKTTINTTTAGQIKIKSIFLNNKQWSGNVQNWNNHKITISCNGRKTSFDFWGSISKPEITTENELIFSLYCFLNDGISTIDNDFFDFCNEFWYECNREADKIFKACKRSLIKLEKVFNCDLYELINELQENYDL